MIFAFAYLILIPALPLYLTLIPYPYTYLTLIPYPYALPSQEPVVISAFDLTTIRGRSQSSPYQVMDSYGNNNRPAQPANGRRVRVVA